MNVEIEEHAFLQKGILLSVKNAIRSTNTNGIRGKKVVTRMQRLQRAVSWKWEQRWWLQESPACPTLKPGTESAQIKGAERNSIEPTGGM